MNVATQASDHAQLMDRIYGAQRHIYDATRKYYLLGRDRLIDELDVPAGGTLLEVGCGTGRNLVKMARRWPDCRLYGIDLSTEMLKSATTSLARSGLDGRIRVAQGDATDFDPDTLFDRRRFDRVVCSYTLSMIPDWQAALRFALSVLAPQGSLHIVDFGEQERLPGPFRKGLHWWLGQFHVEPRAELPEYARALAMTLRQDIQCESLYGDYCRTVVVG